MQHLPTSFLISKVRPPGVPITDLPKPYKAFHNEIAAEIASGNLDFPDHLSVALRKEGIGWRPISVRSFVETWCGPSKDIEA